MNSAYLAKVLDIQGIVQGVGFRPFVYNLALAHGLKGMVFNTSTGVRVFIEGIDADLKAFCRDLRKKHPPMARIVHIDDQSQPVQGYSAFDITQSLAQQTKSTLISPDLCVCKDCLKELRDPSDRRYRYPFINCTNCGPRYTIIKDIPYDRPQTSMSDFAMCPQCQAEYENPSDRRFHAQPNACEKCGPQMTLHDDAANPAFVDQDPVEAAVRLLRQGCILAVKGIGGFHLAVDAQNDAAVLRLRKRKHREEKPLAVMAPDLTVIRRFAYIEPAEKALLTSVHRPIVLLRKKESALLSPNIAPGNPCIGTMLPYAPLHDLICRNFDALVMTSANLSEEPIVIDNAKAFERLSGIADYFLVHNRDICLRNDDSVVKIVGGKARFMRRSRGYAPAPIFLKNPMPPVLGCGAELKNAICLTRGQTAFLSPHIGDLKNLETLEGFEHSIGHMRRILDIHPEIVAYDLHPDYLSTRYAKAQSGVLKIGVQHHHAHIVSCMAENHVQEPVIGLSFDGTGYGADGKIWGGEVLIARLDGFERIGHLDCLPMPGGDAAVKEPWRMAVSLLHHVYGDEFQNRNLAFLRDIEPSRIQFVVAMIQKGLNSPETSSLGRWFDAVAALVGLRNQVSFEGQAAMELEMIGQRHFDKNMTPENIYPYQWVDGSEYRMLPAPLVRAIVEDMEKGVLPGEISYKFHCTLIEMFASLCRKIRRETGLNQVALSGGVFQNSMLLSGLIGKLTLADFEVFSHTQTPCNDGGISLGQAVAAAAMAEKS